MDEILSRFSGVKRTGSGWECYCPHHEKNGDGHRQSLSITHGDDGRILMHCHGGCTTEDIVKAVGLTMRDLFPSSNGRGAKRPAKNHTKRPPKKFATPQGLMRDVVGQLIQKYGSGVRLVKTWRYDTFHVLRFDLPTPAGEKQQKEFRPAHQVPIGSDGYMGWTTGYPKPDKNRPLYRRSEITAAVDTLLVTIHGGEKAADAAAALGLPATTNAGGELAVKRTDWTPLARFALAVIVIDADEAGERFGRMVAAVLRQQQPGQVIKIVRLPNLPPKGDIVEWIAAGGTRDEFMQIVAEMPEVTAEQIAEGEKEQKTSSSKLIGNAMCLDEKTAIPLRMEEIISSIMEHTSRALRRVGKSLFVHQPDNTEVCWIDSAASLFGWLQSVCGVISWRRGDGFVGKEELFCEMQRTCPKFDAVGNLPHWPTLPTHYYTQKIPNPGNGEILDQLLKFFRLETPVDYQLLKAAYATPLWGGPPGTRPAFMFTSKKGRGRGKSKAAQFLARVYNGAIDVSAKEDIATIKTRLLSPGAATKRIAIQDNIKTVRYSWGEFEALITTDIISGKALYIGDASRPNLLTHLLTLNGASLSTDMAQRVVEIQVADPDYQSDWEERVALFIDKNRTAILGDLIGFLNQPVKLMKKYTRWACWEAAIIARLPNPDESLDLIIQRREFVDVEEEEGHIIEDFFRGKLNSLEYDVEREDIFIPNEIATQWYNQATGEHAKVTGASRALKQLHSEGRLLAIAPTRSGGKGSRGFHWVGEHCDMSDFTKMDLKNRLFEREKNTANRGQEAESF